MLDLGLDYRGDRLWYHKCHRLGRRKPRQIAVSRLDLEPASSSRQLFHHMQNSRSTALNGMELHTMLCVRMYVWMDGCTYECVCVCVCSGQSPRPGYRRRESRASRIVHQSLRPRIVLIGRFCSRQSVYRAMKRALTRYRVVRGSQGVVNTLEPLTSAKCHRCAGPLRGSIQRTRRWQARRRSRPFLPVLAEP